MDENELMKVMNAWILCMESKEGGSEYEENFWAYEMVNDWIFDGNHELLWRFILLLYKQDISENVKAALAAGPVEDLLADFGVIYIDRVEALAKSDCQFNGLLGGVWQNAIPNEIWGRIKKVRKEVW